MTEVYEFPHRHSLAGTAESDAPEHTPQPAPRVERPPPIGRGRPGTWPSSPLWWLCC